MHLLTESVHLLSAEEYLTLDFGEMRTELLGGVIYDMSPINTPHVYAVDMLTGFLGVLFPQYLIHVQNPVAVPDWQGHDVPNPDLAIIKNQYGRATAADSFVFFEVSDSTYKLDRDYKIPLYVNAGVHSYIVNIPARCVQFYPTDGTEPLAYLEGSVFSVLGVTISVSALFGPV